MTPNVTTNAPSQEIRDYATFEEIEQFKALAIDFPKGPRADPRNKLDFRAHMHQLKPKMRQSLLVDIGVTWPKLAGIVKATRDTLAQSYSQYFVKYALEKAKELQETFPAQAETMRMIAGDSQDIIELAEELSNLSVRPLNSLSEMNRFLGDYIDLPGIDIRSEREIQQIRASLENLTDVKFLAVAATLCFHAKRVLTTSKEWMEAEGQQRIEAIVRRSGIQMEIDLENRLAPNFDDSPTTDLVLFGEAVVGDRQEAIDDISMQYSLPNSAADLSLSMSPSLALTAAQLMDNCCPNLRLSIPRTDRRSGGYETHPDPYSVAKYAAYFLSDNQTVVASQTETFRLRRHEDREHSETVASLLPKIAFSRPCVNTEEIGHGHPFQPVPLKAKAWNEKDLARYGLQVAIIHAPNQAPKMVARICSFEFAPWTTREEREKILETLEKSILS